MTTTDSKISARILALVAEGRDLPAAVDAVLGAGTYARIASGVFEAFKSSARK